MRMTRRLLLHGGVGVAQLLDSALQVHGVSWVVDLSQQVFFEALHALDRLASPLLMFCLHGYHKARGKAADDASTGERSTYKSSDRARVPWPHILRRIGRFVVARCRLVSCPSLLGKREGHVHFVCCGMNG